MNLLVGFFLLIVLRSVVGLKDRRDVEIIENDDTNNFDDGFDINEDDNMFADEDDELFPVEDDYDFEDDFSEEDEDDFSAENDDDDDDGYEFIDDDKKKTINIPKKKKTSKSLKKKQVEKKQNTHKKHTNMKHKTSKPGKITNIDIKYLLMRRIAREFIKLGVPAREVRRYLELFKLVKYSIKPLCTLDEKKSQICCKIHAAIQATSKYIGGRKTQTFVVNSCVHANTKKILKSRVLYRKKLGTLDILCRLKIEVKKQKRGNPIIIIHPIVEIGKGKMKKVIDLNPSIMKALKQ